MPSIPGLGGISGYLAFLSLADFSLEKTFKGPKFMDMAETIEAVSAVAGLVSLVAGVYLRQSMAIGLGAIIFPFGFVGWFYTSEFHKLYDLDKTRNTIEQSAKNVQISVAEMQERRDIIQDSTQKIQVSNQEIGVISKEISTQEHVLRKFLTDLRDANRVSKKSHKELDEALFVFKDQNSRFKKHARAFMDLAETRLRNEKIESESMQKKIDSLEERQATLKSVAKKVSETFKLKFELDNLRLNHMEEYQKMITLLPSLKNI